MYVSLENISNGRIMWNTYNIKKFITLVFFNSLIILKNKSFDIFGQLEIMSTSFQVTIDPNAMENSKPVAKYDSCDSSFSREKYFSLFKGSSKDLELVVRAMSFFFKESLKVICFALRVNYVVLSTAVAPLNIMSSIFLECAKVSVQKAIF